MLVRALLLFLLTASIAPAAAVAAAPAVLGAEKARISDDRRTITLEVRCLAPRGACRGTLSAHADKPVTVPRRVRLVPRRRTRIALRLRADAMALLKAANSDGEGITLVLRPRGRQPLYAEFVSYTGAVRCRNGVTLAASAQVRVFRDGPFGVHACMAGSDAPVALNEKSGGIVVDRVGVAATGGEMVALSTTSGHRCLESRVTVHDLSTRRRVASVRSSTTSTSDAHGCWGTGFIRAIVVRASGAVAWTEQAGDDGLNVVRVLDAAGDRRLDAAADVDPRSLRSLDATTITWTRGGQAQTAPLS